jgi:hypothetical protein
MSDTSHAHQISRFRDAHLPDGSVERRYGNGVTEQRVVRGLDRIEWNDNRGGHGFDFDMGEGVVRRQPDNADASVGVHLGNGVTSWDGGASLTINETPLPDVLPPAPPRPTGLTAVIVGLGLGGLFGLGARWLGPYGISPDAPFYWLYAEMAQARLAQQPPAMGAAFALDPNAPQPRTRYDAADSFG